MKYCQMDQENTALDAATSNFTAATFDTNGNTIAAGGSAVYQVPLKCILTEQPIPVSMVRPEYFKIRVYFRSGTNIFDSGSAHTTASDITMQSLQLSMLGKKLKGSSLQALQEKLQEPIAYHCFLPERQIQGLGATATGAQISETLTAIEGRWSRLCTFIRAQNATQEQLYQIDNTALYPLDNLTLLDGNGKPFMQQDMSEGIVRYRIVQALGYNSTFLTVFPAYFWNFSHLPVQASESGSLKGGSALLNGNWRFRANTLASAGNNLDLIILGDRYLTAELRGGRFSFQLH